jgi:hypothetical protein
MKTAIQELIEHLEIMDLEGTSVYKKAKLLLIDEKEQIMNAAYYGHTIKSEFYDSETYYYQTSNQNK